MEDEINRLRTEKLRKINSGEAALVGVNRYMEEAEEPIEVSYPDEAAWEKKRASYLTEFRKMRDKDVREAWLAKKHNALMYKSVPVKGDKVKIKVLKYNKK